MVFQAKRRLSVAQSGQAHLPQAVSLPELAHGEGGVGQLSHAQGDAIDARADQIDVSVFEQDVDLDTRMLRQKHRQVRHDCRREKGDRRADARGAAIVS